MFSKIAALILVCSVGFVSLGSLAEADDSSRTTKIPVHPSLKVSQPTFFAVTLEPPGGVVVSDR